MSGGLVYIVERHGVYPQGIFGIYTVESDAVKAAEKFCRAERDDYHQFVVFRATLDAVEEIDEEIWRVSRCDTAPKAERITIQAIEKPKPRQVQRAS